MNDFFLKKTAKTMILQVKSTEITQIDSGKRVVKYIFSFFALQNVLTTIRGG